ncbi:hypothetical protein LAWI1_G000285 [Lachnellula willkommii]|uniref:Integral membrane protein n=1 Tax=Lachnellula willkommii TaxID=215461 RepID=A0A559MM18_9HELO|nr:hypothetical protein LAWI1_G000285 [Lachnellula willkommii]
MSLSGAPVSNEYLHENNSKSLLITAIVFLVLNTILVLMRFAARTFRTNASPPFGWDDLCILLGWLFSQGIAIDSIVAIHFGTGMRALLWEETSSPEKIGHWGRITFYAGPILYSAAVVFPKNRNFASLLTHINRSLLPGLLLAAHYRPVALRYCEHHHSRRSVYDTGSRMEHGRTRGKML